VGNSPLIYIDYLGREAQQLPSGVTRGNDPFEGRDPFTGDRNNQPEGSNLNDEIPDNQEGGDERLITATCNMSTLGNHAISYTKHRYRNKLKPTGSGLMTSRAVPYAEYKWECVRCVCKGKVFALLSSSNIKFVWEKVDSGHETVNALSAGANLDFSRSSLDNAIQLNKQAMVDRCLSRNP
jgi:hypothetical protein